MSNSFGLIYEASKSSKLNYVIREGLKFEVHPFAYDNALVIVIRCLETRQHVYSQGDMVADIIVGKSDGKVSSYSTNTVFIPPATPESVAQECKKRFNLKAIA